MDKITIFVLREKEDKRRKFKNNYMKTQKFLSKRNKSWSQAKKIQHMDKKSAWKKKTKARKHHKYQKLYFKKNFLKKNKQITK